MFRLHFAALSLAVLFSSGALVEARADNHGAIAYSPETGAAGWSYDHPSRRRAERVAMGNCLAYADDCRIATYFSNACGAVAKASNGGWGADWGYNRRDAERNALAACYDQGDNCRVVRWQCTSR
ncbi:MAG TPA: DUF4189 domain-containing protein [Ensifer sp.]|nr:DUF4189 domain-containing protein [Ensifer sp.]